jgi:hypothetical protein
VKTVRVLRSMAVACGVALAVFVVRLHATAAPVVPVVPDASGPATQLKSVPRLHRVHVDVAPGAAIVTHDLVFPKGALTVAGPPSTGDGTIFIGFTAQARPIAIEATRHAIDAAGELVE